jgi:hypothetical protein
VFDSAAVIFSSKFLVRALRRDFVERVGLGLGWGIGVGRLDFLVVIMAFGWNGFGLWDFCF